MPTKVQIPQITAHCSQRRRDADCVTEVPPASLSKSWFVCSTMRLRKMSTENREHFVFEDIYNRLGIATGVAATNKINGDETVTPGS